MIIPLNPTPVSVFMSTHKRGLPGGRGRRPEGCVFHLGSVVYRLKFGWEGSELPVGLGGYRETQTSCVD